MPAYSFRLTLNPLAEAGITLSGLEIDEATLGTITIRSPAPLGEADLAHLREKLATFWRARFASSSVRADLETIRDG